MDKKTVGIALSGGGAKAVAQLGVLAAMEEINLRPDIISGVSAGAMIGALYADGMSPKEIMAFLKESNFFRLVKLNIPKKGLLSMRQLEKVLHATLKAKTFEEFKIPLIVNATNISIGEPVYFHTGSVVDKLIASSSIPIVFAPKVIAGDQYVDGGIFSNIPAKIIRNKCDLLVGVHVNPIVPHGHSSNVFEIAERVFHLTIQSNTLEEKKVCDIVIETVETKNFNMFDVSKSKKIFDIGYDYAMRVFEQQQHKL